MTPVGGPALPLWLGAGTLWLVCGASSGGGTCAVDDGVSLLQAAARLGSGSPQVVGFRPRAGAAGTLCALAPAGALAPEVAAFLKETTNNTQLEHLLSQEWAEACADGGGATDAGLVSRLRAVVHAFAGLPTAAPAETRSDEVRPSREEPECGELESELQAWGLNATPSRVLDYGCGQGGSLAAYGKCGIGTSNVGIDVQDVRGEKNKEFFQFVQLEEPYPLSFASKISSERLDGAFGLVFSEEVFHHIGSDTDVIATSRQLGRTLSPCGVFVLEDWDNPGSPDMTPLYDLTHTFWKLLCLPYTKEKAEKCAGDVSDQQLHEMWEGEHTIYLSLERYREIVEAEAGVELVHKTRFVGGGWNDILHPFQLVFKKPC